MLAPACNYIGPHVSESDRERAKPRGDHIGARWQAPSRWTLAVQRAPVDTGGLKGLDWTTHIDRTAPFDQRTPIVGLRCHKGSMHWRHQRPADRSTGENFEFPSTTFEYLFLIFACFRAYYMGSCCNCIHKLVYSITFSCQRSRIPASRLTIRLPTKTKLILLWATIRPPKISLLTVLHISLDFSIVWYQTAHKTLERGWRWKDRQCSHYHQ